MGRKRISKGRRVKRYEQLAETISAQIRSGVLRAGEQVPSVRKLSVANAMSPATVLRAFHLLEDRGEINARPRSGYYVSPRRILSNLAAEPATSRPSRASKRVDVSDLVFEILGTVGRPDVVPLGSAFIDPAVFPLKKLARSMATSARNLDPAALVASLPPGFAELRRAISRRYLEAGMAVAVEDIVITTGCMEALNLCLQAVTRPGDVVAIESPAFYAALQAIERMGLKAVEIPTHPREGVDLAALDAAITRHNVKACWFMTSFQNPLGALMPADKKEELVRLLAKHAVPLIEDDVYEELYFGAHKPRPAKSWDRAGLVMHCASFSKCLAPGYRIGWAVPGRWARQVERLKLMTTLSTGLHAQAAIADFLRHGGYDHHLRGLRAKLEAQQRAVLEAIPHRFPAGTRVTRPQGGYFVWVELPEGVDALEVHRLAMRAGISVAPGPIFSPQRKFGNCIRINTGQPCTPRIATALATLGRIAGSLA
jgi:DNA-binding transcriptional MocR family regulator